MSFSAINSGRQIPGTNVSSRNAGRQIPGSDSQRRGTPERTDSRISPNRVVPIVTNSRHGGRQIPGSDNRRRGQPARTTYSSRRSNCPPRTLFNSSTTTEHTFTTRTSGRRVRRVSIGVGILAGAILLGLGILFAAPPAIAIGAIILGFSLISTIITVIAERKLELASEF